jgi:tRNA-modifying protein YgfZ
MNPRANPYHALETGIVCFDRSRKARVEVTGPDRARFLHNLTTNDVERLAVDHGQEAFVTSLQGKTLGFVTLHACEDRIALRSDPGSLEALGPHLQKYGVFDDVAIEDVSARTFELHLAGPQAEELLRRLGAALPGARDLAHCSARIGAAAVRIIRETPTGRTGLTLIGAAESAQALASQIHRAGAELGVVDGDEATFEAARIEAGTPCSGLDVTAENLPQEVGRDERAINFVKGCYLGQETVARIDALGHVNKHLRGLRLEPGAGAASLAGASIESDGKRVGTITSTADSPGWGRPVALGYLRTSHAAEGTEVQIMQGGASWPAIVAGLPMLPTSHGEVGRPS